MANLRTREANTGHKAQRGWIVEVDGNEVGIIEKWVFDEMWTVKAYQEDGTALTIAKVTDYNYGFVILQEVAKRS